MLVRVTECADVIAQKLNERTGHCVTGAQWDNWQNGEDEPYVDAAVLCLLGGWDTEDLVGDVLRELDVQIKF